MSYRTYKQWQERDRTVKKGERAEGYLKDGTALFSKKQTKPVEYTAISDCEEPDSWYMGDEYDYS